MRPTGTCAGTTLALRFAWLGVSTVLACFGTAVAEPSPAVRLPVTEGSDIRFARVPFEEGPSRSSVRQILQDNQGFLWFGTQDGLKRYDGYRFREYRHQEGAQGLSGSSISDLFKDRDGTIWVASDRYLDRYDPVTERFTPYRSDLADSRVFEGGLNQINQDPEGFLWLATTRGLTRLDPITGKATRYRHAPEDPYSLSSDHVKSTLLDREGIFWVVTTNGLDILDRATGKVTRRISLDLPRSPSEIGAYQAVSEGAVGEPLRLFEDRSGVLWVICYFGPGLAVVDRRSGRLTSYGLQRPGRDAFIGGVEAIHESGDGMLWLATARNGLLRLDPDRRAFVRYRNSVSDPNSLSSDFLHSLLEDREGNLWVGSQGGGINRCAARPLPFRRYRHEPGNPNSLDTDEVSSVYQDSQGILWVGSRVTLNRIDRKTGRFTFYRTAGPPRGPSNLYVLSIIEDRSGYLWFGTSGGGLNRFDRRTGRFKVYCHLENDSHSLSNDIVYSLFVDSKGTLWAGTDDGLDRFDPETEQFTPYRSGQGADSSSYRGIAEDSAGNLWLATVVAGLHRFDPGTGRFTLYRHGRTAGTLSNDWVNAVRVDHAGMVWAGTLDGLNRLEPKSGVFRSYYERDGLPNSNLTGILEDERGDLWMGTNKGLVRFNPSAETFVTYHVSDGIAGNEFYRRNAAWKSPSGEMFFGSSVGLSAFFPGQIVEQPYAPPIVLTDFLLAGKPASIGGDSPLRQSISTTQSIQLSHKDSIFSFEFAALSYVSPGRNRYRYMLEGLETNWNETDASRRTAMYTTLPPSTYTFRVQGASHRGVWNLDGRSIRIQILPPVWSMWWFRTGYVLLFMLSAWAIYRYRLGQATRQFNLRMEERFAERMRIAQDLHDTLLQGFISASMQLDVVIDQMPDESPAKPPLDRILHLVRLVIEEGRNSVKGLRSSSRSSLGLEQAFSAIRSELAVATDVSFRVVVDGRPRPLHPVLRDEVYRIGREALVNAFRHSKAGNVEIRLEYTAAQLRAIVRDDGCGIDPEVLRAGREGHWGLPGMRERAERVGARLKVWSRQSGGTQIELSIPGDIAFQSAPRHSGLRLFAGWFG